MACSIVNAPDEIVPGGGNGGAGGATTSTTSAGGGGSGGAAEGGGGSGGGGGPPGICGDGVLTAGEECDDGDLVAGDACDALCNAVTFDIAADAAIANDGPDVGPSGVDGGKGFLVVWREDNAGVITVKSATYTGERQAHRATGGDLDIGRPAQAEPRDQPVGNLARRVAQRRGLGSDPLPHRPR